MTGMCMELHVLFVYSLTRMSCILLVYFVAIDNINPQVDVYAFTESIRRFVEEFSQWASGVYRTKYTKNFWSTVAPPSIRQRSFYQ